MRILMYHEVTKDKPADIHAVSEAQFRSQMSWLREAGFTTVGLSHLLSASTGGASHGLPANGLVITFDDGYRDNYTTAWPILAEYGLSATIFLVAGRMGLTSDWRAGALSQSPLLSWAEAREMAKAGIGLGSHTVSHSDLASLDLPGADRELREARDLIEQALGRSVDSLAYPYGRFTPAVQGIARQVGYQVACSCPTDYVGPTNADPYDLRRITMLATDQHADFVAKVRGSWRLRLVWYRRTLGAWRRRFMGVRRFHKKGAA
jgi:peptidoglycan/xylan/chitin deacetylase (PgdA/CDA1 family)